MPIGNGYTVFEIPDTKNKTEGKWVWWTGAIINDFNTRFGIDNWTDDDKIKKILFEHLLADFAKDQATVNSVNNSDKQNAKITSDKKVEDLMLDVIFTYEVV